MRLSLLINRSGVVTTSALTGLLFVILNGEQNFFRLGVLERWFGWPFVYYGHYGPSSLDYKVYIFPMVLNFLVCAFIAGCVTLSMSFVIRRIGLDSFPYHAHGLLRMISIACFGLFALLLFAFGENVSICCGPRDTLEFSKDLILGPRFVLNPMG